MKRIVPVSALVLLLALAGCSAPASPAVESIPTPTPTPTVSTTPDAEPGTRANPLSPGETRKLATDSMWSVGADGPTVLADGHVVLPLRVAFDWEAGIAQGLNADAEGIAPYMSLTVRYVTAGGTSFETFDNYDVQIPNQFYALGTVYPPAEFASVNVPVSVPNDQIPGGVWSISNSTGAAVFVGTE